MRPQIVYIREDNTVNLDRETLEKLIKDAYEQGFSDGKASAHQYWSLNSQLPNTTRTYFKDDNWNTFCNTVSSNKETGE